MELKKGMVTVSLAGRDKNKLLTVLYCDGKTVMVADGGERPLDNPKRKNPKHLKLTGAEIDFKSIKSDKALRKALREIEENLLHSKEAN